MFHSEEVGSITATHAWQHRKDTQQVSGGPFSSKIYLSVCLYFIIRSYYKYLTLQNAGVIKHEINIYIFVNRGAYKKFIIWKNWNLLCFVLDLVTHNQRKSITMLDLSVWFSH